MEARSRMPGGILVAAILLGVSACATPQAAHEQGVPPAAPGGDGEQRQIAALKASLQTLQTSESAGRTGTLKGVGTINVSPAPPLLLATSSFSLIPSTPDLEALLDQIGRAWREGRRRPVSNPEFQAAFGLLDRHVLAVRALGGGAFIREAQSDDKGGFTFDNVPEGRWLLVTELQTPVSALVWAIRGRVIVGKTTFVKVSETNVWIEGHRSASDEKRTP